MFLVNNMVINLIVVTGYQHRLLSKRSQVRTSRAPSHVVRHAFFCQVGPFTLRQTFWCYWLLTESTTIQHLSGTNEYSESLPVRSVWKGEPYQARCCFCPLSSPNQHLLCGRSNLEHSGWRSAQRKRRYLIPASLTLLQTVKCLIIFFI